MERKEPSMNREALLRERKNIISNLVFLLTAAVVVLIAVGTMAWFASNKEVSGDSMAVTISETPFELAVPDRTGADTRYNTLIEELGYSTTRYTTEGGSIRWVMKDEDPNKGEDYQGFRPGSYGSLTFYILPNSENISIFHIKLDLTGYYAEFKVDEETNELTDAIMENSFLTLGAKAEQDTVGEGETSIYALADSYLQGHILFFQNCKELTEEEKNGVVDTNLYYSDRITGSFSFDTTDYSVTTWNGRTAYEVVIYWVWPNTFSQLLLDNGDDKLINQALFSSKQSGSPTPREDVEGEIALHPNHFFHSSVLSEMSTEDLENLMSTESLNTTNALITLSNGYNGADQVIGENVQFFLVELTVSDE